MLYLILAGVAMLVVARPVYAIVRFVMLPAAAKRHYPAALWAKMRWRWLCANLQLSYLDRHKKAVRKVPFGSSVKVVVDTGPVGKLRFPRAKIRADEFGMLARVKTVPGVGRDEFEKARTYIADQWSCHRVGVTQPRPGRLLVRGMRRDPLAEPVDAEIMPAFDGKHLMLGVDEWGQQRRVSLANLSGSVVGGNPGRGKTLAVGSWAVQLLPSLVVRPYVLDGKGGGDWTSWQGCAAGYAEEDLAAAVGVLEDAHAEMVSRLARVTTELGTRNAWSVGPVAQWPLIWILVDECHQYLDVESAKVASKEADRHVRTCRMLLGQLLRKGRSVMVHTTLVAQKATSTSIPTELRDLAGLRLSFGVSTTDMAIAVLGDDVRTYPGLSPTQLQGDEHVGVASVRMRTGGDPYTRVRVPYVSEDLADKTAQETADRLHPPVTTGTPVVRV